MVLFHTDLDNTMIYSYKHEIGADKRCAEVYHGREISYITKETYRLLQQIKAKEEQLVMVPTTTRTTEQYQRIHLGIGDLPYALVCNGGVLLAGGREDENWYRGSLERIRDSRETLHQALELLDKESRRSFELRFIRELFVFTKCQEPEAVVCDLKRKLDLNVVEVFRNGEKVYVLPKALSKGSALQRFKEYFGAAYTIAAGDSEFDCSMLEAADLGIVAPALAQNYSFQGNVVCPSGKKIFAEAVLALVLARVENCMKNK
ncbi:MAG: HAD hydrolase family protein [Lachnospiraceae bacterium]|jgi:hydroxymethylpyrimidine pyrophosphatase-like HAD family hydrolase|nr:HAD hydrolase family protein [Lachnospiraceae bacterium]